MLMIKAKLVSLFLFVLTVGLFGTWLMILLMPVCTYVGQAFFSMMHTMIPLDDIFAILKENVSLLLFSVFFLLSLCNRLFRFSSDILSTLLIPVRHCALLMITILDCLTIA